MRMTSWTNIAATSVLAFGLVGCADTSTRATGMTDDELDTAVTARLEADPQLRAYDIDVDADADQNKITLSGTVPSQDVRNRAVEIAKDTGSDLVVTDEIEVDPTAEGGGQADVDRGAYTEEMARAERDRATQSGEKIGDNLDDAWIHTKIRTKLAGEGQLPFGGLNVDVVNNAVTLRGTVGSQEAKMEAERIAKETEGVASVQNQLTVKPGE